MTHFLQADSLVTGISVDAQSLNRNAKSEVSGTASGPFAQQIP